MSNPIDADLMSFKKLEELSRGSTITDLNEEEMHDYLHSSIEALNRFTMGGRSTCLIALSLLLWKGDKSYIKSSGISVEELLSMSFRIITDPSFIFPEWGAVLAGVVIAKHLDDFSEESLTDIDNQCKLLLRHLTSREDLCDAILPSLFLHNLKYQAISEGRLLQEAVNLRENHFPKKSITLL